MEKEPQLESLAAVTIKPDYPPSEVYGSEPPPAYHRSQSSSVQVAKIIAVTVVLVSLVLGSFILASAYVSANASCKQLEQELQLLSEAADRFQPPPQPEALIQEEPTIVSRKFAEPPKTEETQKNAKEIDNNNIDDTDNSDDTDESGSSHESEEEEEEKTPVHFKLPLQLDFDDIAGALIEKNQKSRMNCVVEKKRAEEVVDHQPKTVRLPFGVNLTTDPRYERLSGERMAIFCESGNIQSHTPPQEEEEETIMIQPVMIPIPTSHFPTHMPQQMQPMPPPQQYHQQYEPQQYQHQIPVHPMETMRPPMPPMMRQQGEQPSVMRHPMPQQMHQVHPLMQIQQQREMQVMEPQQQQQQEEDNQLPPAQILHHIAQQIITQRIMEAQKARAEQLAREQAQEQQSEMQRMHAIPVQENEEMVPHRIPIPEEVLTRLNRLPNREVIVAVQEQEPEEEQQQEVRIVQQPRQSPSEMSGRQAYARGLPINIPVPMMQQVQQEQQEPQPEESEQQEQVAVAEEQRPHYVQPRSVRSVDALLPKSSKRVKRCSCDCSC